MFLFPFILYPYKSSRLPNPLSSYKPDLLPCKRYSYGFHLKSMYTFQPQNKTLISKIRLSSFLSFFHKTCSNLRGQRKEDQKYFQNWITRDSTRPLGLSKARLRHHMVCQVYERNPPFPYSAPAKVIYFFLGTCFFQMHYDKRLGSYQWSRI